MCLVFDWYHDFSIKSRTRLATPGLQASRRHKLSLLTPVSPQKVVLTVTEKNQLIEQICHRLIEVNQQGKPTNHKLVVTAMESSPTEFHRGLQRRRDVLKATHDETCFITIQEVANFAKYGAENSNVLSDDTYVFIVLVYHFSEHELQRSLTLESTSSE